MNVQEAVQQLQQAPVAERIQAIELLLQSLKEDISPQESQGIRKPFIVRTFDLGGDTQWDREELYATRGL